MDIGFLELGGGPRPHPHADIVLDHRYPKNSPPQDIADTPWRTDDGTIPDDSVTTLYSSHIMEHIPRGQPLLNVMNEAWRVLRPGGSYTIIMPIYGYTDDKGVGRTIDSWQPFADPTHVNFWWMPEAFSLYFCKPHLWAAMYDIRPWEQLGPYSDYPNINWNLPSFWALKDGWECYVRIQKPDAQHPS